MNKLVTFGCSVTDLEGVKEELAQLLQLPLLNVAECASSNQLQLSKLSELIVHNQLNKDDIIYWQITSVERDYKCLALKHLSSVQPKQYVRSNFPNVFDKQHRLHLLCNSPLVIENDPDDLKQLEMLLSTLILLKQLCPKTIVIFGWESLAPAEHIEIFKQKLNQYNIEYVNEGYVDFAVRNQFPFEIDDMHPSKEAGQAFANVVFEKMKSIGWA